ncbi:MAG: hypothetical protein CMF23_13800 [Ignavibacteriae bacterium]|nr:hypothetical protein [Ignavibacteriota bacterium]|tara:strand:- start:119 stop:484 length:366 start_codon:yes stop_codon:yes gene_type:complete
MESFKFHIIDDNPIFLDKAVTYLNSHKAVKSIGWSLSLNDFKEKNLNNEFDFILVDYSMPVQNGIEALKFIKERINSTKVFILSINKENLYKTDAENAGADGYICKDNFVDEIEYILKGNS